MYRVLAWMARMLVRIFYRVERIGPVLSGSGPVVFVGNHSNGLVDPALFVAASPRPVRFLAKFTLFEMPVLGRIVRSLGAIPIYRRKDGVGTERNEQSFVATFDALEEGQVLGLFPEGTSHSGSSILPLKTGAARIALGAEARARFELGVRIQPLGLVYDDRRRFRSRVTLWSGEPFTLATRRERHQRDAWEAVTELTSEIEEALRGVVIEYPDELSRQRLEVLEVCEGRVGPRARRELMDRLAAWRRTVPARVRELEEALDRILARLAGRRPTDSRAPLRPLAVVAVLAGGLAYGLPLALSQLAVRWTPLDEDKDVTVLLIAAWFLVPLWIAVVVVVSSLRLGLSLGLLTGFATILLGLAAIAAWPAAAAPLRTCEIRPDERAEIARWLSEAGPSPFL